MDTQDHHIKDDSSEHENHVCHKCGWSFSNPHPSANHRRAHKKLCGTIEGYKLIELNSEHPHLAVSDDDEQPSDDDDDDLHTPSPGADKRKVEELGSGGGGGGVGERSNKSEGEMFADAVMDFSDGGVSSGIEKLVDNQLLKVNAIVEHSVADLDQSENATMDQSDIADVAESLGSGLRGIEVNPEESISKEVVPLPVDYEVEVSHTLKAGNDDKLENQHDGVSAFDISFASSSRADSLEGHWGSVSVVSAQSDSTTTADAGGLRFADAQPPEKSEAYMQMRKRATDEYHRDKLDSFEPPSFMTLVESGNDVSSSSQKVLTEIETAAHNKSQPDHVDLQAGWFPSLSNVVNESQGRKKNEEIIAKVSNWSTGKQHVPLKTQLAEAKSPTVTQSDQTAVTQHSKTSNDQAATKEVKKEGNYPTEIKKEKGKRARPYWVSFVCCSSGHRDL